jgi:hypothetical protein
MYFSDDNSDYCGKYVNWFAIDSGFFVNEKTIGKS